MSRGRIQLLGTSALETQEHTDSGTSLEDVRSVCRRRLAGLTRELAADMHAFQLKDYIKPNNIDYFPDINESLSNSACTRQYFKQQQQNYISCVS